MDRFVKSETPSYVLYAKKSCVCESCVKLFDKINQKKSSQGLPRGSPWDDFIVLSSANILHVCCIYQRLTKADIHAARPSLIYIE